MLVSRGSHLSKHRQEVIAQPLSIKNGTFAIA